MGEPETTSERRPAGRPRLAVSLAFCAIVLVATALVGSGGGELETWAVTTLINVVFVVALYIFVGNSGVLSFGHMSFAAVGAYVAALMTIPALNKQVLLTDLPGFLADVEVSSLVSVLVAGALAAVLAGLVGVALMRLSGIGAGIATLALLVIVQVVVSQSRGITGGTSALTNIPVTTTVGVALAFAAVAVIIAALFQSSATGLRLRAARDEEVAARAVGVSVFPQRWTAFVLSAFLTGVAGALYVHAIGAITADALYLQYTFLIIAMLVIGGIGSLVGAVGGAVVVSVISEILVRGEQGTPIGPIDVTLRPGLRDIVLAALMLAILIWRPAGIFGSRELSLPRWLRRGDPPPAQPADAVGEPPAAALTDATERT